MAYSPSSNFSTINLFVTNKIMKWWPEKNPFSLKKGNIEVIMDSSLSATKKNYEK